MVGTKPRSSPLASRMIVCATRGSTTRPGSTCHSGWSTSTPRIEQDLSHNGKVEHGNEQGGCPAADSGLPVVWVLRDGLGTRVISRSHDAKPAGQPSLAGTERRPTRCRVHGDWYRPPEGRFSGPGDRLLRWTVRRWPAALIRRRPQAAFSTWAPVTAPWWPRGGRSGAMPWAWSDPGQAPTSGAGRSAKLEGSGRPSCSGTRWNICASLPLPSLMRSSCWSPGACSSWPCRFSTASKLASSAIVGWHWISAGHLVPFRRAHPGRRFGEAGSASGKAELRPGPGICSLGG